jgi:hypothetical protein
MTVYQSKISLRRGLLRACCLLLVGRYRVPEAPRWLHGRESVKDRTKQAQKSPALSQLPLNSPAEVVELFLDVAELVLDMLTPLEDCKQSPPCK